MTYRVQRVDGIVEHETISALAKLCSPGDETFFPDTSRGDWWLAYATDVAIGFAGLRDSTVDAEAAFLCLAGVHPAFRGHGLQRRLINVRVRRARALGKLRATSWTATWNVHSANNLLRAGFALYTPTLKFDDTDVNYWKKEIA